MIPTARRLATLVLALPAAAQDSVIVVDAALGPGADFATLQEGIAAAGDDDLILVRSGYYGVEPAFFGEFKIERPMRIVAAEGASVFLGSKIDISGLDAGETVVLRGLELDFTARPGVESANLLNVHESQGLVFAQDLRLVGPVYDELSFFSNTVFVKDARLVLCSCVVVGGGTLASYTELASLGMQDAEVTLYDSVVRCHGEQQAVDDFPAVRAVGSRLFVSGSTAIGPVGEDGGLSSCPHPGGPGIWLAAGGAPSELTVLDSYIAGGPPGAFGGAGGCGATDDGPAVLAEHGTVTYLLGNARSLDGPATAVAGASAALELTGEPGDLVLVGAALAAETRYMPALSGVALLAPPFRSFAAGVTDASGALAFAFNAPTPAPGTEAFQVYVQAVFVGSSASVLSSGSAMSFVVPGL